MTDSAPLFETQEDKPSGSKRKRDDGLPSDDSDLEDLRGFSGTELALRNTSSLPKTQAITDALQPSSSRAQRRQAKANPSQVKLCLELKFCGWEPACQ